MAYLGDMSHKGIRFFAESGITFPATHDSKLVMAIGVGVRAYVDAKLSEEQTVEYTALGATVVALNAENTKLHDPDAMSSILAELFDPENMDTLQERISAHLALAETRKAKIPLELDAANTQLGILSAVKSAAGCAAFVRHMGGRQVTSSGSGRKRVETPTDDLVNESGTYEEGFPYRHLYAGAFYYLAVRSKVSWELWARTDKGFNLETHSEKDPFTVGSFSAVNKAIVGHCKGIPSSEWSSVNAGGNDGVVRLVPTASAWIDSVRKAEKPETAETPINVVTLCQGETRAGNACKNRAVAGASYCRAHAGQAK